MVINGRPGLACAARLAELGERIELQPLRKFPCVEDLMVDRSVMFRKLAEIGAWLEGPARTAERAVPAVYEASRCLQCGCCLEICPNWSGETFGGMAAAVPVARLLAQRPENQKKELSRRYRRQFYEGCGKALSCRDICPVKIDIESLQAGSNAAAVWRRFLR